jgi:glyoxylase-like metal-dependent hydrolase (beta-lactamase superfamily II)
MRTTTHALSALLALAACGDQDNDPIDQAITAAGGEDALAALTSYRLEVAGTRYFAGEELAPGAPLPVASVYTGTLTVDVAGDASRFDIARTIKAFDATVPPQSFTETVRGNLGHVTGDDGLFGGSAGDLAPAGTAAIRRQQRLLAPTLVLRDVAADRSLARDAGVAMLDGRPHHLVEVAASIAPLTLFVDDATGQISQMVTRENDHVLRDVDITATFADWQGVPAFPAKVTFAVGDQVVLDEQRTQIASNVAIDPAQLAFPAGAMPEFDAAQAAEGELDHHFHQAFGGVGFRLDVIQGQVDAMELVPGVFRLGGGTHNSLAIEQADGIVIVDAPLYGARSQAILAWAAQQFPDKSISRLIVSHFHDDHIGGVREFVAAGVPVISGSGTEGFLEASIAAPSTLSPDALAAHPQPLAITRVASGQTMTLADAAHPIDIIPIANQHAIDMVYVRLPSDNIDFVADLYSPGFPPVFPVALKESVYQSLLARGGASDTIVGAHGGVAPFSQLATETGH